MMRMRMRMMDEDARQDSLSDSGRTPVGDEVHMPVAFFLLFQVSSKAESEVYIPTD